MKIEFEDVVGIEVCLPKVVSDCANCGGLDSGACDGSACKTFEAGSIHLTHRRDLDLTFTHIVLNCTDPHGEGLPVTVDGKKTLLET